MMKRLSFMLLILLTSFLLLSCSRKVVSSVERLEVHDTLIVTVTDTVRVREAVSSDVQRYAGSETLREVVKTIVLNTSGDTVRTHVAEKELRHSYDSLLSLKDREISELRKYASTLYANNAAREVKEVVKAPNKSFVDRVKECLFLFVLAAAIGLFAYLFVKGKNR